MLFFQFNVLQKHVTGSCPYRILISVMKDINQQISVNSLKILIAI